ncbi:MAG: hypothetical protein F6K16_34870, partial [Symploca sp. SIO2B6]|nr:hypothetical protein [Symploca sp. SIO2B6]
MVFSVGIRERIHICVDKPLVLLFLLPWWVMGLGSKPGWAIAPPSPTPSLPESSAQTSESHPLFLAKTYLAQTYLAQTQTAPSVVPISSAADTVAKFNASQQLYIKGNNLSTEQISRLTTTLHANPNVFVVVLDDSTDVLADDNTLSRGIANSAAFQSVVHPITGERQGVLFMIYFDSDQGRKIFMRSESLPDRLGVGEGNFADENNNPRALLTLFRNAVHRDGKDMPGALEAVINQINGTIRQQIESAQGSAQQTIEQVAAALAGFPVALGQFRNQFSVGGPLGNPDTTTWDAQLQKARTALANSNFADAQRQSQDVLNQIRTHETAMVHYGQAPEIAASLQTTLDGVGTQINGLPTGGSGQQASQKASPKGSQRASQLLS